MFRRHQSQPVDRVVQLINPILRGWVKLLCGGAFQRVPCRSRLGGRRYQRQQKTRVIDIDLRSYFDNEAEASAFWDSTFAAYAVVEGHGVPITRRSSRGERRYSGSYNSTFLFVDLDLLQLHQRLGGKEGSAPHAACSETKGLRVDAME